jgi:hypothetical protein
MMFPGPYSTVIRNEAGEPVGFDTNYPEDNEPDYDELDRQWEKKHCIDCGELHHECKCDRYCADCGEFSLSELDPDECENKECPSHGKN